MNFSDFNIVEYCRSIIWDCKDEQELDFMIRRIKSAMRNFHNGLCPSCGRSGWNGKWREDRGNYSGCPVCGFCY